jgi:hypothetical protein
MAHPFCYDVNGLGFYYIPHAPVTPGKPNNTKALVTKQGGEVSIAQLVAELNKLIPSVGWNSARLELIRCSFSFKR